MPMGRWGTGNFDEDTAADHLAALTDRLVEEIERAMTGDPVRLEPDEYWGVAVPCNLELLYLLASRQYVGVILPEAAKLRQWKETYLAAWEKGIDQLGPKPGFKRDRRAVLEITFDQLIEAAEQD